MEIENLTNKKIKKLRPDRVGKFLSKNFVEFCKLHGIVREVNAPYTPPQMERPKGKIDHFWKW